MSEPRHERDEQPAGDGVRHVTSPERPPFRGELPSVVLEPGAVLGGFRLLQAIGQGGMGRVFLAHDDQLDRRVALKVLPPEEADDEGRARFLREARALARVDHPHVVHVFASGIDKELAWMALEYIEGEPLCDALAEGPFDEETALSLVAQAARGLAAVHEVGVVHRDVKPDNLLLDASGLVRLVDFGVALFEEPGLTGGFTTRAGIAIGTPHYMAPEQARGGKVDHRADTWALGATLWALLVGRPPFFQKADDSDMDILARVLHEPVRDVRRFAKVSRGTAELVHALLEKEAEKRPSDLVAVAEQLELLADEAMERAESGILPEEEGTYLDEAELAARETEVAEERARAAEAKSAREAPTPVAGVRLRSELLEGEPGAADERADETAKEPPSPLARVLVLVALVGLLGAAAFVIARLAVGTPPSPTEPHVASSNADGTPPEPSPERPSPQPAAPEEAPAGALKLEGVREVSAPNGEAAPAPSEAEERVASLVMRVKAGGAEGTRALTELLDDEGEAAKAAVRSLVVEPEGVGARVIEALSTRRASPHVSALGVSLFSADGTLALRSVAALDALRNDEALELLQRAAKEHPEGRVRRAALNASRTMFSVED